MKRALEVCVRILHATKREELLLIKICICDALNGGGEQGTVLCYVS